MNNEKEIKNLKNNYSEIDNIKFEKIDNDIIIDRAFTSNGPGVEDLSKLERFNIHNDIMKALAKIATANMDSKILSEEEESEEIEEESPIITEALNIRYYIEDGLYKNENINQNLKEYDVRVRLMYPEGITKETENCLNNNKQNGENKLPIILILFGTPVISISLFRSIEFSLHKIVNDINIINDDDKDISDYIEEIYISYDMFNDLEETSEEIILDYSPSYKSYSEFVMRHDNKILRGPNGIVEFKGFGIDDCSLTHVAIYRDLDKDQLYHSIPIYEIFNGEFSPLNKE